MYTVYLVKKNADSVEGRGPMITVAAFDDVTDASAFAKTVPGVMGHGCGEVEALQVAESLADHADYSQCIVRERALKKLTPEEKAALGL